MFTCANKCEYFNFACVTFNLQRFKDTIPFQEQDKSGQIKPHIVENLS